jgi:uracil-DNA glycosylase
MRPHKVLEFYPGNCQLDSRNLRVPAFFRSATQSERDRPAVEADIARCQPDVIAAVGAHAIRWCLGHTVHGVPVEVQIGDHKAVCVPVYHPANFLYGRIELAEKGKAEVLTVARVLRGLIA